MNHTEEELSIITNKVAKLKKKVEGMEKNEYMEIFINEVDSLEKELRQCIATLNDIHAEAEKILFTKTYTEVRQFYNSSGQKQAEHQIEIIDKKTDKLETLLRLPDYARTQAMSFAEIQDYIKKVGEFKVGELYEEKKQYDQLCQQLAEAEKEYESIKRGDARSGIREFELKLQIIPELKRKLDIKKQELKSETFSAEQTAKRLSKLSNQQIKDELCPNPVIEKNETIIINDEITEMFVSLSSDSEELREVAWALILLANNNSLKNDTEGRARLEQRIKELVGSKSNSIDYSEFVGRVSLGDIMNKTILATAEAYSKQISDKIKQVAQKQADVKEAELRGITVEELLEMKEAKDKGITIEELKQMKEQLIASQNADSLLENEEAHKSR